MGGDRKGKDRRRSGGSMMLPPRPSVGDGGGKGKGGASASRNPGLAPVQTVSGRVGRETRTSTKSQFARDSAPHVGQQPRSEQWGRTIRKWDEDETSQRTFGKGKGRTISMASSIAPGRVFTAADADAGVNAFDLAADDKWKTDSSRGTLSRNRRSREYDEEDMDAEQPDYHVGLENEEEFFHPPGEVSNVKGAKATSASSSKSVAIATRFTSPPLIPGFISALEEMFGKDAKPTPVQGLSLSWVMDWVSKQANVKELQVVGEAGSQPWKAPTPPGGWREFLLAAETGSGKSIAYLLPMLQSLKQSEPSFVPYSPPKGAESKKKEYSPRAVVLAPTHELSRQLAGFAKDLCHFPDTRLKVVTVSRANVPSTVGSGVSTMPMEQWRESKRGESARKMTMMQGVVFDTHGKQVDAVSEEGAGEGRPRGHMEHGADVIVGTPMKLLEMVRGRGWDRITEQHQQQLELQDAAAKQSQDEDGESEQKQLRRGRDRIPHFGTWRPKSEMGLENVEWVIVDEADVLFDPDFQETTRLFLADVSAARGYPIPFSPHLLPPSPSSPSTVSSLSTTLAPVKYPFNLLLTSATIPTSLNTYLTQAHPSLLRLASPNLHKLPKTLQVEYVAWSGGNKFADILRRLKRVWAEDASSAHVHGKGQDMLSQVVIFCNRSSKAEELGEWLEDQSGNGGGVKGVVVVTGKGGRQRGNNKHLESFLRARGRKAANRSTSNESSSGSAPSEASPKVLITTSILSRGLDFSPNVKHVFIIDAPRNMVDFVHRAGRAGRAGMKGRVVVFGKMKGRGSKKGKEIRGRVAGLM
ncbi:ATP-dependent RNA helicase MRH4, mitochondrial [Psilocybe cubensis]|uniref:ATP-dependent RNA helicase MRH4, mitochondrial n=2 Tax=Psilocybe cubensis TaxID=181762 RepID=A0ACB8GJS5_PSICU|nr:ATP-dependent RNA helicase MRH4, mitochondrial [Psilocybe cubensis]KAH9475710.1 ATP-dependent RNA helicase MRH4, mitochondrial [Psilocybe cubensis]